MIKTVFFDLDGTLTDSCPGIFTGVSIALSSFGITVAPENVTREVIGPPLFDCFHRIYGLGEEDTRRAVALYREYYGREGLFENEVGCVLLCRNGYGLHFGTCFSVLYAFSRWQGAGVSCGNRVGI